MGCTSSLSFRDVYVDLQKRWGLDPKSYGELEPKSVHERSILFSSLASGSARQASQGLLPEDERLFKCDSLLVEQAALLKHPLFDGEGNGMSHPYHAVLFRRLLSAVAAEHARHAATGVFSIVQDGGFIARWDYRIWMMACCEFYHVLAILQEQKALPKATMTFMKALTRSAQKGTLLEQGSEGTVLSPPALEKVWREGSAVELTTPMIGAPIMEQIRSQMPSILARVEKDAGSTMAITRGESLAPRLIALAKECDKRVVAMAGEHDRNPLRLCETASAPSSVPLLVFAEWAAMECALSFCGQEEDPASYGVVPVPFSSVSLPCEGNLRQQWRARLLHLGEVERELAELKPLSNVSEVYKQLLGKAEGLKREAERHIARCRPSREALTTEDVEEMSWRLLDVKGTLPNRTVHHILFRKAFECVAGAGGAIVTTSELCEYLRYYLAFHGLYCDILFHQLKGSELKRLEEWSLPTHIDFHTFRIALAAAQARRDAYLDPLLNAAIERNPLTPLSALDVVRELFDSAAESDAEDGMKGVSFDAVCAVVKRYLTRARHISPHLRSIDKFRSAIGVDEAKQQHAFTTSFLREVFTLNQGSFSGCSPLLAARALEAAAELPQYTNHSACVAAIVVRYASLDPRCWCALSAGDGLESAALTRWLSRLRSESIYCVPLAEDPAHMDYVVRALFCVTAAQRIFEDTAPEAEKSVGLDIQLDDANLSGTRQRIITSVTQAHFTRAAAAICEYLECPAEVLLNNAQALLHSSSSAEDVLVAQAVNPNFTIEHAFRSFQSASHLTVDWDGCDKVEEPNTQDRAQTVRVPHVLFVMVLNYTRQHCSTYWQTHMRYDGLDAPSSAAEEDSSGDHPKWDGGSTLLALSRAMPLGSLAGCYRLFAQLAEQEVQCGGPADSPSGMQAAFLHAFYVQYMPFFQQLHLDEGHVTEVGVRALQFIASQSGRASSDMSELGITRRDFSSFLEFILGYLMVERVYESAVQATREARGTTQDAPMEVFLSEQDLRRLLGCFARLTKGGVSALPTLEEARLWLRSRRCNSTCERCISLQDACLWYSSHRVEHYALESVYDWWRESYARRIPFTMSTEHCRERQYAMRGIRHASERGEDLSESCPVDVVEEEGYLSMKITSAVLERRWGFGEVTTRVFCMGEEAPETTPDEGQGEAHASPSSLSVPLWLDNCHRRSCVVLHRIKADWSQVHCSDFRSLLQYVHHFVSAYISLYYALAVLEVSSGVLSADSSVHEAPSAPAEHQAKTTELFLQSLLPLLSLTAVPAEVSSVLSSVVADMWHDMQTKGVVLDITCRCGAHSVAAFLVSRPHLISPAPQSQLEGSEDEYLCEALTIQTGLPGVLGSYEASSDPSYWERLRTVLPFGPSLPQRQRRGELFRRMDYRQRGYLTVSDITHGLMEVVRLQSFRADFTPVLLRAFRATKDAADESQSVVYLTQHSEEQVLMPWEFNAFLAYLYRYLELYFMFDVLTCGGHIHPETLHVVQKQQRSGTDDLCEGESGGAWVSKCVGDVANVAETADASIEASHTLSTVVALCGASMRPYEITLEATPMKKEVSLVQFQMARQLLRRWGAHVDNTVDVFQSVNQRCREGGTMLFNGFAIWASKHGLRPEGSSPVNADSIDAAAIMS
ncbi:hypothetical protein LSCM1_05727 [Leishmania martiniquensis]|uniref:Flagellar calcium-binding protein EF-hand domain-containing protein n=1 Tax=Leishmania martiniquensis TaxID=1580590 RepID=A0A836HIN9_9TRYP|nr:hypothetical protein LSCM1_05727 [Leishmania martiniquensis]